jgi:hypothetical protein
MRAIDITYLNGPDVERLARAGQILAAVDACRKRARGGRSSSRASTSLSRPTRALDRPARGGEAARL